MRVNSLSSFHRQRGVVLAVSLIILLLLTITGVASIQNSTLQEKMAGNSHDHEQAFLAAEAALRAGEIYLAENVNSITFEDAGIQGFYNRANTNTTPVDWQDSDVNWLKVHSLSNAVAQMPEYFLERLPDIAVVNVSLATDATVETAPIYRITAQGYGKTALSRSVVTSTYRP